MEWGWLRRLGDGGDRLRDRLEGARAVVAIGEVAFSVGKEARPRLPPRDLDESVFVETVHESVHDGADPKSDVADTRVLSAVEAK
jgi:hypothetical protein